MSSGAIKQYLTLLQAQPEPGRTEQAHRLDRADELPPLTSSRSCSAGCGSGMDGATDRGGAPMGRWFRFYNDATKRLAPSIRQPTPQRRSGPAIEYAE